MEQEKSTKHKGGRPPKAVKKDQQLAVMCDSEERKIITWKAVNAGLTISEYLRQLGVKGQVESRKSFPKEALQLIGTIHRIAANLNQIARKRNRNEDITALEHLKLDLLLSETKELVQEIKSYLR